MGYAEKMNTKKKNILTAVILIVVAVTIYVFAVMQAIAE
jgi:hypothetical protein